MVLWIWGRGTHGGSPLCAHCVPTLCLCKVNLQVFCHSTRKLTNRAYSNHSINSPLLPSWENLTMLAPRQIQISLSTPDWPWTCASPLASASTVLTTSVHQHIIEKCLFEFCDLPSNPSLWLFGFNRLSLFLSDVRQCMSRSSPKLTLYNFTVLS